MGTPKALPFWRRLPLRTIVLFIVSWCALGDGVALPRTKMLDKRAERIWRKADGFLCSCFCAARSYGIDQNRLFAHPSSIQFGLAVNAIPVRDNSDDLKFWIDEYLLHRLIRTPLNSNDANFLGALHEFSSSVIARAPPRLSFGQQLQLLNQKTRGEYYHLVQLSEGTGDPKAWRQRRAMEQWWFGQAGSDGRQGPDGPSYRMPDTEHEPPSSFRAFRRKGAHHKGVAFSSSQSLSGTSDAHTKERVKDGWLSGSFIEQDAEWTKPLTEGAMGDLRSAPDDQSYGETQLLRSENGRLLGSFIEEIQHRTKRGSRSGTNLGGTTQGRELVLNQDRTRYETVPEKQKVWKALCRKECYKVAEQSAFAINFQHHNEFAFLKRPEDPYNSKSWVSSEPLHAGDAYVEDSMQSEESEARKAAGQRRHWEKTNRNMFSNIFHALRFPESSVARRLPTCTGLARQLEAFSDRRNGEDITWSVLLQRFGVLRHPAQMAEPPGAYVPLRKVSHPTGNIGVVYYAKKPTAGTPRIYKNRKPVPVDAALAIHQKLISGKHYPVQWPVNTPSVVATPVSPQYWFTAELERTRKGQYKLVSHFAGRKVEDAPMFVEFLGLYVQAQVAQVTKQKVEEILEEIWAPFLMQRYGREGVRFGHKEVVSDTKDDQKGPSKNLSSASSEEPEIHERSLDGKTRKKRLEQLSGSGSLSGSQLRARQPRDSKRGSGMLDPGDGLDGSQDATDSHASFHERNSVSSLDTKGPQRFGGDKHFLKTDSQESGADIQSIYIEYVGEVHLGCWLYQAKTSTEESNQSGQSPLLSMEANNRLVFVIRGVSARLRRFDGLELNTVLEGEPIALEFFSPPKQGLAFIMEDSHKQFRRLMSEFRGWSHKLIRFWLLGMFSSETDGNVFTKNTCPLIAESAAHTPEIERTSSIVEKGIAAGDSPKTSISPWIYKVVAHAQAGNFNLYGSAAPPQSMPAPDTSASSTLVYLPNKLLRDSLNQYLMKCYGRILPTAAIGASTSPARGEHQLLRRWECLDVPVKRRYELVERVNPLAATSRNFT